MRNNPDNPTLTLPLLIAYTQALLPSLNAGDKQNDNAANELLWAVADSHEAEKLERQLAKQLKKQAKFKNRNEIEAKSHINTLAQLDKQSIKQRYELGCFWLPSLSEEQLQQFVPTIMRYRDLYAAHLLIAVHNTVDLRAYGFTPFNIINEQAVESMANSNVENCDSENVDNENDDNDSKSIKSVTTDSMIKLWQFNLYDYKLLPNWLNNKYWANPENWDKRRW